MENKSAVIMVNWNGSPDTIDCLKSIIEFDSNQHIYLLDNGSQETDYLKLREWIRKYYPSSFIEYSSSEFNQCKDYGSHKLYLIKSDENLGFSKGNNFILRKIYKYYNYCTLLNNDTLLRENSISKLNEVMDKNSEISILSCRIQMFPDIDKLWNAGGSFKWYGDRKYFSQEFIEESEKNKILLIETPFITGCVLMFRKDTIEKYGLLTEDFFFGEEDFNYCMRLKKSGGIAKTYLNTVIYHKVSASIKKASDGDITEQRRAILHYSNRIVNMKNFYPMFVWKLWRYFYLFSISSRMLLKGTSKEKVIFFIKKTLMYTKKNIGINYDLFKEINSLNMIKGTEK